MGCTGSQPVTPQDATNEKRDAQIAKQMKEDHNADMNVKRLLLLGAGESGKSTLFKQMIALYGKGYTKEDRVSFTKIVYNNTISAIRTLVKQSDIIAEQDHEPRARVAAHNMPSKQFIMELKGNDVDIDAEVASHISSLWADEGIQFTYDKRATYQLNDSAKYFLDKVQQIGREDYIPTEQDVLRTRVRTTGIVETTFDIEGTIFKMFDVGGQRNERKKWIHCFDSVTAVIFVAAMSEYDQMLFEDETHNRMAEALDLFDEVCNSRWFKETSIILFLNKKDLFAEKIKKVDLSVCFPEYDGGCNFEAGAHFIQDEFESKNHSNSKEIYTHLTCATDTTQIKFVFNAVKDMIIRKSLQEGGLMS